MEWFFYIPALYLTYKIGFLNGYRNGIIDGKDKIINKLENLYK